MPRAATWGCASTSAWSHTGACGTPTGTATFFDGATQLGTPTALNPSGVATLTTTALILGSHSITAKYNGDPNYGGSTSSDIKMSPDSDENIITYTTPISVTIARK